MNNFLCIFIGLSFLVSSMLASENSLRKLNSRLRHTAGSGTVEACEKLLAQGAAINGRGQGGATPLFIASQDGRIEIVKFLLGYKADINASCETSATPLYVACQNGHISVVQFLLESKARVSAMSEGSITPLLIASQKGHSEIAKLVLEGKADVNAAKSDGTTPLYMASQNGHCKVVKLLLGSKALVNSALDNGSTPLFAASQNGHGKIVKLLLKSKSKIDAARDDGITSLYIAKQQGHSVVVSLLLEGNAQRGNAQVSLTSESGTRELDSQLRHTAGSGSVAACKKLLSHGAAINGRGQGGATPLFVASQNDNIEVVKLLLGSSALVNAACDDGATPLFIAGQKGHVEVVNLLLGSKAQISVGIKNGATPLFIASQEGKVDVVKLLLRKKAQANTSRNDSVTPLIIASQNGRSEVCQHLLRSKAAMNQQTKKEKETALHVAVLHNHLNCVTVLLKAGAAVTVCDARGDAPLVYAARQRNRELCVLLSKYGAVIKVSRWGNNKNRKELAMYVHNVLKSKEGGVSSTDSDYPSSDHVLNCDQDISQYSAVPSAKPQHYEKILSTLHTVAQEGDCGKLEMIFEFGVPVDQLNDKGYTALLLAVLGGHYEMCAELLKHGADKNISTPKGETALQIAQRVDRKDIVKLLKKFPEPKQGAVSSTDANYQTPNRLAPAIKGAPGSPIESSGIQKEYEKIFATLHDVAQTGDCGKLEMIFGFGVPVDSLNTDGYTALHLAVLGGHYKMCSQLLTYGADNNIETPGGETALQIAQRIGNKKLIELLDLNNVDV